MEDLNNLLTETKSVDSTITNYFNYDSENYEKIRKQHIPDFTCYLNSICAKSSHNTFQSKYSIEQLFKLFHIRSFEFDLHTTRGIYTQAGNWFVYHNILDLASRYYLFTDVLYSLANLHQNHPDHEVITIFLDCNNFSEENTPAQLDALIRFYLGSAIYTPANFKGENISIHHQIKEGNYPTLEELRGKFIFILTKSTDIYTNNKTSSYSRLCFVADNIDTIEDLDSYQHTPFFNLFYTNSLRKVLPSMGFMVRVWTINLRSQFDRVLSSGCHFIASDEIDPQYLPGTSSIYGYPFLIYNPGRSQGLIYPNKNWPSDIYNSGFTFQVNLRPRATFRRWYFSKQPINFTCSIVGTSIKNNAYLFLSSSEKLPKNPFLGSSSKVTYLVVNNSEYIFCNGKSLIVRNLSGSSFSPYLTLITGKNRNNYYLQLKCSAVPESDDPPIVEEILESTVPCFYYGFGCLGNKESSRTIFTSSSEILSSENHLRDESHGGVNFSLECHDYPSLVVS